MNDLRLTDRGRIVVTVLVTLATVLALWAVTATKDGCWDGWQWAPDCAAAAAKHGGGDRG